MRTVCFHRFNYPYLSRIKQKDYQFLFFPHKIENKYIIFLLIDINTIVLSYAMKQPKRHEIVYLM